MPEDGLSLLFAKQNQLFPQSRIPEGKERDGEESGIGSSRTTHGDTGKGNAAGRGRMTKIFQGIAFQLRPEYDRESGEMSGHRLEF